VTEGRLQVVLEQAACSHGNPAGAPSISFPRVRRGSGPGAGDLVQRGRRPGQVHGAAHRRTARRVPSTGARCANRAKSLMLVARSRSPPSATPARCPGRMRATCPSSAAPCSARPSVPNGCRIVWPRCGPRPPQIGLAIRLVATRTRVAPS
jgi:hypothetical protein